MPVSTSATLPPRRLSRFALTGCVCAVTQLALLALLTRWDVEPLPANVVAFLLAAQLNFALSATVTWGDRRGAPLLPRWFAFLGAVSATALLNLAVFELTSLVLPVLAAAATGIATAACLNYLVADHAVFRRSSPPASGTLPVTPFLRASSPTLVSPPEKAP